MSNCVFVGGFVFVFNFSQSSEMPDQTSYISWTSNALFNLLPKNFGRPELRTFKLSISFLIVMGMWKAERFLCSFTCLFYWLSENSVPPFHARDRKFLALSYAILIKQIFHMLTDSAISFYEDTVFLTVELLTFSVRLEYFPVYSIGQLHSWSLILYGTSVNPLKSEPRSEIDSTRAIPPEESKLSTRPMEIVTPTEQPKLSTQPMEIVTPTEQPLSTDKPTKGIST